MTANQLKWAEIQEGKRHNLRTEGQTDVSLRENQRHNLATESINSFIAASNDAIGRQNAASNALQADVADRKQAIADEKWSYESALYPDMITNQYVAGLAEISFKDAITNYYGASAGAQDAAASKYKAEANWKWVDSMSRAAGVAVSAMH